MRKYICRQFMSTEGDTLYLRTAVGGDTEFVLETPTEYYVLSEGAMREMRYAIDALIGSVPEAPTYYNWLGAEAEAIHV